MFCMQVKTQNKLICQKVILFFQSNKNELKRIFGYLNAVVIKPT